MSTCASTISKQPTITDTDCVFFGYLPCDSATKLDRENIACCFSDLGTGCFGGKPWDCSKTLQSPQNCKKVVMDNGLCGDKSFYFANDKTIKLCEAICKDSPEQCQTVTSFCNDADNLLTKPACKTYCSNNFAKCDDGVTKFCFDKDGLLDPFCGCIHPILKKYADSFDIGCDRTCVLGGYRTQGLLDTLKGGCMNMINCRNEMDAEGTENVIDQNKLSVTCNVGEVGSSSPLSGIGDIFKTAVTNPTILIAVVAFIFIIGIAIVINTLHSKKYNKHTPVIHHITPQLKTIKDPSSFN
jgi:hypothetical protein